MSLELQSSDDGSTNGRTEELQEGVRGDILRPGDEDYDEVVERLAAFRESADSGGPKEWVAIPGGHLGPLYYPSETFDRASSTQSRFLTDTLMADYE